MKRLFPLLSVALLPALCLIAMTQTSCVSLGLSEPEFCNAGGGYALMPWVEENWTAYCQELDDHLTQPQEYSLKELTAFFSNHSERVDSINSKLRRYDRPDRCFSEPQEQLQLRNLRSCIAEDADQDFRITNSWKVRAEPWIDDYKFRIRKLRKNLETTEKLGNKIEKRLLEKFANNARMDQPELAVQYDKSINNLEPEVQELAKAKAELDELISLASSNQALASTISGDFAPIIGEVSDKHEKNEELFAKLKRTRDFFVLGSGGVGKSCPRGIRARTELKAAKGVLEEEAQKLGTSMGNIGILSKKRRKDSEDGFSSRESFRAFVCAKRSADNQFQDRPKLCTKYLYTIYREKGQDDRNWDVWMIKPPVEGAAKDGVDCTMME